MKRAIRGGPRSGVGGFTLIEVMIVVAIIAILVSLAYPSYAEHVEKGRRAQATPVLLQFHQYLELYRFEKRTDQNANIAWFSPVPPAGVAFYTAGTPSLTDVSCYFELGPVRPMAGDPCGKLVIDNYGRRSVVGFDISIWDDATAGQAAARAYCWAGA